MAKKTNPSSSATSATGSGVKATTPVRNSAVPPRSTPVARRQPTHEEIARRAYEIAMSGQGGSDLDNWLRAERELRGN